MLCVVPPTGPMFSADRWGISKDGHKLKPPMFDDVAVYYKTWTDADMNALIAWIRTIPPIE